ncbi:MAG: ATP-binding domain-containing protein, partial [Silvanigrellaceae bacterium]|nr:ATP-binding domain-containing protein [Silvanigrellaceae bacterium]
KIISEISYEEYLRNIYPEDFDERWLNIIELKNAVIEFEADDTSLAAKDAKGILSQFIEQAMLTIEPTVVNVKEGHAEAVTLMTIHAAKGLEFKHVFLTGLEEGVLPHQNALENPEDIEEERRLVYVAVTRAQEKLTLTWCKRNRYRDFIPAMQSRFLGELPEDYIDDGINHLPKKSLSLKSSYQQENGIKEQYQESDWRRGQRVSHKIFGEGIVKDIEKSLNGFRLKIEFEKKDIGEKTLVHTFVTPL